MMMSYKISSWSNRKRQYNILFLYVIENFAKMFFSYYYPEKSICNNESPDMARRLEGLHCTNNPSIASYRLQRQEYPF